MMRLLDAAIGSVITLRERIVLFGTRCMQVMFVKTKQACLDKAVCDTGTNVVLKYDHFMTHQVSIRSRAPLSPFSRLIHRATRVPCSAAFLPMVAAREPRLILRRSVQAPLDAMQTHQRAAVSQCKLFSVHLDDWQTHI